MPKPLSILIAVAALSVCAALAYAQEASPAEKTTLASNNTGETKPSGINGEPTPTKPGASASAPASLPSPEGQPEPTPKPRKISFLEWLFGSRREKSEATRTPLPWYYGPTPKPRHGSHKPSETPPPEPEQPVATGAGTTPKPAKTTSTPRSAHGSKPVFPSETTPKPSKSTATPKPEKVPGASPAPLEPTATPASKKTPKTKPSTPHATATGAPAEPTADADEEAKEKQRFEMAKSKANEDPQIKSLKAKADEATTEEESKAALRTYNKALFEKVKKIDPSVSEWADRLEAAILKRLSE